ncbi:MAG: ABC transporter substrate-binding protein [Gemmatimonadota bacterium]
MTAVVACAAVLVGSLACSRAEDPALARGATVTVAYCCDREVLAPEPFDMPAKLLVFLTLLSENEHGELTGRLARTWEHSTDGREWTYHLRSDVRWHDGIPVTAHDVEFSLDVLSHPEVGYTSTSGLEAVTVVDDSTVTIRAAEFDEINTWIAFFPKHLLERLDPTDVYQWNFWTQPVGNGPYRFVRYVPGISMEFEANRDFPLGTPRIQRVVLKFSGAGLTELLAGQVDAVLRISPAWILRLETDPRFRVYHYLGTGARAIYWQSEHPLFHDPRVRRALTLAIDRRQLQRVMNLPEDVPLVDGPFTRRQLRSGRLPAPLPYDPSLAVRLLEEAGWRDDDDDGVRERDGRPFRFTALVRGDQAGYDAGLEAWAVFVQEQFRRVGVQMGIQPVDPGQEREQIRTGAYGAAFTVHGNSAWWLQRYFGPDSPFGYRSPRVLELVEQDLASPDPVVEDRVFAELMEIFRRDVPATLLSPWVDFTAVHRRVRGLSSPWRADPVEFMEDLWIEEPQ